jgi:hypothetical protein
MRVVRDWQASNESRSKQATDAKVRAEEPPL